MTRRSRHLTQLFGYLVLAAAVLLTAWKGTLDWTLACLTAVVFGLPGVVPLVKLIREWKDDRTP